MTREIGEEIIDRFVEQLNDEFQKSSDVEATQAKKTGRRGRELFTITRMIAPCSEDQEPQESDFFPVLCRDLSSMGMSFWLNDAPASDWFAVKFEINSEVVPVQALVTRVTREFDLSKPPYLVECEFQGRFASQGAAD